MKTSKILTIAITLMGALIFVNASAQTNISGTWKRNDNKTDAGGLSINSVATSLEIIQDKSTVIVKGTNKNSAGEVSTYTDILKLDGNSTERKAGADRTKSITAKWSADGKSLTESATYKDEQGNVTQTIKQTFALSDDGKTLRITDERNFDGQAVALNEIFDKQ